MQKGNVLVIGNSGVGKSTLINSVLGEDVAKTGWGSTGTTDKLEIYESPNVEVPFRVIDTIGFVPNRFKQYQAINAVKKWSKECTKKGMEDNQINVIWFCVDGTSRKLFPETIKNLTRAISMWKSIPVVVAITKSYSEPERDDNIKMVQQAFAENRNHSCSLREIVPVVASTYVINDTAFAAPEGISELIACTNKLMPEGIQAAQQDIARFILNRKRVLAQSVVTAATTAGAVVGAVPIPIPDAAILTPTEVAEVNAIAKIYGIGKDAQSKNFLNSIIEVGTVSTVAKALITALKGIPGINVAASVLNAVIAGVIVAALGEGSIYAFEQVYLGNKTTADIDWVKKLIESKLTVAVIEKIKPILAKLTDASTRKEILGIVMEVVAVITNPNGNNQVTKKK